MTILYTLLAIIAFILLIFIVYIAYLFISYKRLPDKQNLKSEIRNTTKLKTDTSYRALTFNIGYGAYSADYSFFMEGGKSSRAYSPEAVKENINGQLQEIESVNPDLIFLQEVDIKGHRSKMVNEVQFFNDNLPDYSSVFSQNYNSAYLFYPFTKPIGSAKSGILTLAKAKLEDSVRYSLPIDTDFNKLMDLDRCFSASKIPLENGKYLQILNTHVSAYSKNAEVKMEQFAKLFNFIDKSYQDGNYVIVGGDFNHDIIGNSPQLFNGTSEREQWEQPFPIEDIPEGFTLFDEGLAEAMIPTARSLNIPYQKGESKLMIIDGFLVSNNIKVESIHAMDLEFAHSDHNPVYMDFKLI
ncbi:endonuclease/exonuclease/phosphatase family protein [Floricoccus penangensis]|uniref:endonuclease/exonuclease/phosphatase family protein n=1 Tax=Floricoccus penangensis TaxID=1859475 RepID=UPI00203E1D2B|nr:endonuclease/exonuclease/phosphatase family protein [Floricoccus penangensis]URZ88081.1 hydrolase [Floricoccus penangensis]